MVNKMSSTKNIASKGRNIETIDMKIEVPVSMDAKIGFAVPAVEIFVANLVEAVVPLITAAVPPPAIMANDQRIMGLISAEVATTIMVPAIDAKGKAIESSSVSINGNKKAIDSNNVAVPKIIIADNDPIQTQFSFKVITLK